ncbi:very-short-patch-repair endonuclease [Pseudoclavibacter sp. JAI123]|uniref:type IV toxin-antitoxin system AbiEi family antitoxin domain-containing protein n=1 Tax=Pseudoclavibacter sp. JAI123 TaxID=2723065 RepID=UPI0015CC92D4|nr:type IV toxin-antitoxin system AbiEi family antitoxin domain-containing protein [Pseudoclavibacter sp. JAI123]NYF12662.1 very-short-patch-repair endonuclease [Pseudoclavibacter sp. JAI123]
MTEHASHTASITKRALGGVFSRAEWLDEGLTDAELRRAMREGQVARVCRGWYEFGAGRLEVKRAVRARARLTCMSALALHGAWDLRPTYPHVRIRFGERGHTERRSEGAPAFGPSERGLLLHRPSRGGDVPLGRCAVDDVQLALRMAFECLGARDLAVVSDSLLNRGLVSEEVLLGIAASGSAGAARKVGGVDGTSMSGTETLVRFWLRGRGCAVETQAQFDGVGYVDLFVDGWLIVECDSREFHVSPAAAAEDRRRDLLLVAMGFVVVRLTYEQVMVEWESTEQALLKVLARGRRISRRFSGGHVGL